MLKNTYYIYDWVGIDQNNILQYHYYLRLAKYIHTQICVKRLPLHIDLLGLIFYSLVWADSHYDPSHEKGASLTTFRIKTCKFAILKYYELHRKRQERTKKYVKANEEKFKEMTYDINFTEEEERLEMWAKIKQMLTPLQYEYCYLKYNDGITFKEIGVKYGVSTQAVEQTAKVGLAKLKDFFTEQYL